MRLPTWDELSDDEEQLNVLETPLDRSLFVAGPPGSGKTSLAIYRADALRRHKARQHDNIPVITYNRMLRRSLQLMAEEGSLTVAASTMHHFVGKHYYKNAREKPPAGKSDTYAWRWKEMIERLEGRKPDRETLVIDEGQSLPADFFIYASRYIAKTLSVFADEDQAIGKSRSTLEQIKSAANLPDPIILSANHRNTPEIARLAEHFHRGRLPTARVIRSPSRDIPKLVQLLNASSISDRIVNELRNRAGSIGVIASRNETVQAVHGSLRKQLPESRVDFYSSEEKNEQEIDIRKPGITVLNKESVKGQEFDTVFLLELERFIPCSSDADYRSMYMICTRARDRLFLVHAPGALAAEENAALPGADILERA